MAKQNNRVRPARHCARCHAKLKRKYKKHCIHCEHELKRLARAALRLKREMRQSARKRAPYAWLDHLCKI